MIDVDTDGTVVVFAVGSPLADAREIRSARERAAYANDMEVVPPLWVKVEGSGGRSDGHFADGDRDDRRYLEGWRDE